MSLKRKKAEMSTIFDNLKDVGVKKEGETVTKSPTIFRSGFDLSGLSNLQNFRGENLPKKRKRLGFSLFCRNKKCVFFHRCIFRFYRNILYLNRTTRNWKKLFLICSYEYYLKVFANYNFLFFLIDKIINFSVWKNFGGGYLFDVVEYGKINHQHQKTYF
jgi:hypothetical protein